MEEYGKKPSSENLIVNLSFKFALDIIVWAEILE
jgi:hypothetical protein